MTGQPPEHQALEAQVLQHRAWSPASHLTGGGWEGWGRGGGGEGRREGKGRKGRGRKGRGGG